MKAVVSSVLAVSLSFLCASRAFASAETDLAAAAAAGHAAFVIVSDATASGVDVARRVAGEAQKLAPATAVVELDRGDRANAALVKRYRLASAPVPLILVVAANGVAAGGAEPRAVTAVRLVGMIPTPGKASFLKALDERKASFIVFTRATMPGRAATLKAADDAVLALKGAAVVVSIDLETDRATEAAFMAEMKVDPAAAVPTVVVYNAKGQSPATYVGAVEAPTLVAAAQKQITSSCGPGGCGPDGCK